MDSRTAKKNQVTADAIVSAAEDLLAEGGPGAVTLEAIAQRADVAVQTIYNRVGGRAAVLTAIAEQAFAANKAYLDEAYVSAGTPMERIREVAAAYVRFAVERPNQYRLLAFPPPGAPSSLTMAAMISEQNAKFAAVLQAGIDEGHLDAQLDAADTATLLWRMWDGVLDLLFRGDDLGIGPDRLPALLAQLERIVEFGITPRPGGEFAARAAQRTTTSSRATSLNS